MQQQENQEQRVYKRAPSSFHFDESNGSRELIVTGVYQLNVRTGELRYGGSLFKQRRVQRIKNELEILEKAGVGIDSKKVVCLQEELAQKRSSWDRRKHYQLASARLLEEPIVVNFGAIPFQNKPTFPHYRRLEKFIREVCMPRLGMYKQTGGVQKSLPKALLQTYKRTIFMDKLSEQELLAAKWYHGEDVESSESSDSDDDSDDAEEQEQVQEQQQSDLSGFMQLLMTLVIAGYLAYFILFFTSLFEPSTNLSLVY